MRLRRIFVLNKAGALPAKLQPPRIFVKQKSESRVAFFLLFGNEGQHLIPRFPQVNCLKLGTALSLRESWWAQEDSDL